MNHYEGALADAVNRRKVLLGHGTEITWYQGGNLLAGLIHDMTHDMICALVS